MKDAPARSLTVRILALGEEDGRCLSSLKRALRSSWAAVGRIEVLSEAAGDDAGRARATLVRWCGRERADVVLTIGRAGHRGEDFAPDVTGPLLEPALPGIEECICLAPPARPEDLLFRGRSGLSRRNPPRQPAGPLRPRCGDRASARPRGRPRARQGARVEDHDQKQMLLVQTKRGAEAVRDIMGAMEGQRVGRVVVREPTLEDAYVRLVGGSA